MAFIKDDIIIRFAEAIAKNEIGDHIRDHKMSLPFDAGQSDVLTNLAKEIFENDDDLRTINVDLYLAEGLLCGVTAGKINDLGGQDATEYLYLRKLNVQPLHGLRRLVTPEDLKECIPPLLSNKQLVAQAEELDTLERQLGRALLSKDHFLAKSVNDIAMRHLRRMGMAGIGSGLVGIFKGLVSEPGRFAAEDNLGKALQSAAHMINLVGAHRDS